MFQPNYQFDYSNYQNHQNYPSQVNNMCPPPDGQMVSSSHIRPMPANLGYQQLSSPQQSINQPIHASTMHHTMPNTLQQPSLPLQQQIPPLHSNEVSNQYMPPQQLPSTTRMAHPIHQPSMRHQQQVSHSQPQAMPQSQMQQSQMLQSQMLQSQMPQSQMPQSQMPQSPLPQSPMSHRTDAMMQHTQRNDSNASYQSSPPQQPISSYSSQSKQLDPDLMPSVVQVMEENRIKLHKEDMVYITTKPITVPPMVSSMSEPNKLYIQDGGCARPNHFRSTIYQVPITEDILKVSNIPFSFVMKPFDEDELTLDLVVPVSDSEIVRCNRCSAYMNPFMRFTDGGRRFQCALCHHVNDVPSSYFAHLDHIGDRLDKVERPELYLGSYEFRTPSQFCRNNIQNCRRPHIIFAFELTVNSKLMLQQISKHLFSIIKNNLPFDTQNTDSLKPMVGFVTYNSKIQMYDIVNNNHVNVICDISSTFSPFTTFLADPVVYADKIENFLSNLPSLYLEEELETETILGPVIEAALQACQVDKSNWLSEFDGTLVDKVVPSGKVYLFHCTLPTYGQDDQTPGRLKPRWNTSYAESRKLLGTDKEKMILSPDPSKYYTGLAQRCVTNYGSGVELFLFPPANGPYLDIASLSELVRLTGTGGIYKYFNDYSDRFINDLKYSLQSSFAFDAIMKVRTSTGIRPTDYHGNFYARSSHDVEFAAINAGASIAVEIKYDDKLPEDEFAIIQTAILYTSVSGERRVRIHNVALPVCNQASELYKDSCCDTIVNYLFRSSIEQLRSGSKTVEQVKDLLKDRCIKILSSYRRHCASPGSFGQLILPEALKLLPVYIIGALKCDAIDGGPDMMPDDKAFAQIKALGSYLDLSQVTLYPRLLRIEYCEENDNGLRAVHIRCAAHRIDNTSAMAYILENSFYIFLFLPNTFPTQKHQTFIQNVFGLQNMQQIQPDMDLPELLTEESQFIRKLIEDICKLRRSTLKVFIVRHGIDKIELLFRNYLYEDKKIQIQAGPGESGRMESPSYLDFLCYLHKEIRNRLCD